jgi:hypothetical protein
MCSPSERRPAELVELIEQKLTMLRAEWDRMYPHNPVAREGSDD